MCQYLGHDEVMAGLTGGRCSVDKVVLDLVKTTGSYVALPFYRDGHLGVLEISEDKSL